MSKLFKIFKTIVEVLSVLLPFAERFTADNSADNPDKTDLEK